MGLFKITPAKCKSSSIFFLCVCVCFQLKQDLELFNLSVSTVRLQSAVIASVSLSFEVTLSSSLQDQNEGVAAYMNYLNNVFENFTGADVQQDNRGLIGVSRTGTLNII